MLIESLEKRLAPAGIVVATVNNGVLTLTGDAADNVLLVREIGPDEIRVSGFSGTSISYQGQTLSSMTFADVGKSLTVKLQGGHDRVTLQDVSLTGNLTTDMGSGDLGFTMLWNVAVGGNVTHTGGNGADEFRVTQGLTVGGKMTLNLGGGSDTVNIAGALLEVGKGLTIDGGAGDDTVEVNTAAVDITGSLNFSLGKGANQVRFESPGIRVSGGFSISNLGHNGVPTPSANVSISAEVFTVGGNLTISHGAGSALNQLAAHSLDGTQLRVGGNVTLNHGSTPAGAASGNNLGFGDIFIGGKLSITAGTGVHYHTVSADRLEVVGGISIVNGNIVPTDVPLTGGSTITTGTLIASSISISNGAGNFENHIGASGHGRISGDVSIRSAASAGGGFSEVAGVLDIGGDLAIRQGAGLFSARISLSEQGPLVIGGDFIVEQTGRGSTTLDPSSLFIYGADFGRISVGGDMAIRFGNGSALTMMDGWSLRVGGDLSLTMGNTHAQVGNDNMLSLHEELRVGGDLKWRGGSGTGFSNIITAPTIDIGGDLSVTHQRNTTNSLTITAENRATIGGLLSYQINQGGDSNLTLAGGDFTLGRGLHFLAAAGNDSAAIGVNTLSVTGDIKLHSGAGTQNSYIAVANAAALYLRGSLSYAHGSGDGNFHISGGGVITGGLSAVYGAGGAGSFALSADTEASAQITINGPVNVSTLAKTDFTVAITGVSFRGTFGYSGSDLTDNVSVDHSQFSGGLQLNLRGGSDSFAMNASTVRGAFTLVGGADDDSITLGASGVSSDPVHFLGPVSIRLEGGHDTLSIGGGARVFFHQRASFDGGADTDELTMLPDGPGPAFFLSGAPTITSFESQSPP